MQVHRPGYRDQTVNENRGAKASVRINGGSWLDVTNDTVEMHPQDRLYGGIGGGHRTIRLALPLSAGRVLPGINQIEFRFNGTDGFTNGYRVLRLHFARGGVPRRSHSFSPRIVSSTTTGRLGTAFAGLG